MTDIDDLVEDFAWEDVDVRSDGDTTVAVGVQVQTSAYPPPG